MTSSQESEKSWNHRISLAARLAERAGSGDASRVPSRIEATLSARLPHWQLGVADLSQAFRRGDTDPVQVACQLLERIERFNPDLSAFVALNPTFLQEAEASRSRIASGAPLSALDGIALAIKDNLCVAGQASTWGGQVFGSRPNDADERPIARLRAAGAIFIGMTNTPEFSVEGHSSNRRYGTTANPWDLQRTPGGSSSGSVAAVAAGLAIAAIGTDGGGSIRRPAGYCGLTGLKPGINTVPRGGGLPQLLMDFETVGPIVRHARDLVPLLTALHAPASASPTAAPTWPLRILYVPRLDEQPCDAGILACCRHAMDRLADQGHAVTEGNLPLELAALNAFWPNWSRIALALMRERMPQMERASPAYLQMADEGAAIPATALLSALESVATLRRDAAALFDRWDMIAMPASAAQPWPLDRPFPEMIDGQPAGPRGHAIYTGWVNAAGLPAVSIPVGPHADGLPVGLQLIGPMGGESMLIALAEAMEDEGPGWQWPPLASA